MKIAVVGCGAVGSFYGAKLARAGHEVHFLLRSDYEVVRSRGVRIQSPEGDFEVRPLCAKRPEEIGPVDLVLVGLKTTANDQFFRLLPPVVSPATAILTLQNGLGNEERLASLFPTGQIMGGLCFVCLNRVASGLIRHLGYGQVVLGEFQRPPAPRTHEFAARFCDAGVPCTVTENLAQAHWEKLVWNIPFNGLGVAGAAGSEILQLLCSPVPQESRSLGPAHAPSKLAARWRLLTSPTVREARKSETAGSGNSSSSSRVARPASLLPCLTTDKLLADARWARLVRELMLEVISAARALGFHVPDAFADEQIARTQKMGAYKASTLIDFERGQPLELESLFLEPLRRAAGAGVPVPRLSALCAVLT